MIVLRDFRKLCVQYIYSWFTVHTHTHTMLITANRDTSENRLLLLPLVIVCVCVYCWRWCYPLYCKCIHYKTKQKMAMRKRYEDSENTHTKYFHNTIRAWWHAKYAYALLQPTNTNRTKNQRVGKKNPRDVVCDSGRIAAKSQTTTRWIFIPLALSWWSFVANFIHIWLFSSHLAAISCLRCIGSQAKCPGH